MRSKQLRLLPYPRPLVDRFGETFFRSLPQRPGVYLFCGAAEGVLYVGKAKNLRKRLGTYRVANSDRLPRRMIRLLQQVTRIEWDECASEFAASCREELLIAVLQPRFNRAGKVWPRPQSVTPSRSRPGQSTRANLVSSPADTVHPPAPRSA